MGTVVAPRSRRHLDLKALAVGSSVPMTAILSGRRPSGCYRGSLRGIACAVAQHGPKDIEPPPSKRQHHLDVGLSFHTFAVVVAAGGGAGLQRGK